MKIFSFLSRGALFFLFFSLLFFCSCKETKKVETPFDFETLMGKDYPGWSHVKTVEDFENLAFFKGVYEKNIQYLKEKNTLVKGKEKIPQCIHFIWIGPKPFPRESVENVRSWIAHHPGWEVKFWTDRERPLPHPLMKQCLLKDFQFLKLKTCFDQSDNYGEKSDLLRYEILFQEGGIYVDHDVKCLHSFAELGQTYDFYCGMEVPYPTCLSSSVLPTNNIIGSKPSHLLLSQIMKWLEHNWDKIEKEYPGKDKDAIINRVAHRTFLVLGETFKLYSNQEGNVDIALPTLYFNAPEESKALFARHTYAGSWFENESEFEKTTRKRLVMLSKKMNKLLLLVGVLGGLNIALFIMGGVLLVKQGAFSSASKRERDTKYGA